MEMPSVGPQHTKAGARDHGLNRIRDTIVIGLQAASKTASSGIPVQMLQLQRTRAVKMPSCIA
jgi:hypothetical protein